MKPKNCWWFALAGWLLASGVVESVLCQALSRAPVGLNSSERAVQFFRKMGNVDLDAYLKRMRRPGISQQERERWVATIRKEDIILPSAERQAKLDKLQPVLDYHERSSIQVKILRLGLAWVGFLEGAAVVISEEAIDLLSAEELQAVIAHELGHEYFAADYDLARKNGQYDIVKEVELRCDAVSIITMKSLGLEPDSLMSGVSKITKFNEALGVRDNRNLVTSPDERRRFCQSMKSLANDKNKNPKSQTAARL